ncbi:putative archaeosortase D [Methanocaldococcus lauensis]|nr:putative archaeosortase D [Methanocaldococcus lauensis]
MENKKYLINFLILFPLIYFFIKPFEYEISKILAYIIGNLLKTQYFDNVIIYNGDAYTIISACTCSLEMSLFLGYVFATPKVPIKYKFLYSIFGIFVINIANILRIILILKNSYISDYNFVHNIWSFIIFPVALLLNFIWVKILLKIGIVK